MSRREDRARAELGLIFRNGHLVRKEDWYAIHPTREMRAEQQAKVNSAVAGEMASKFGKHTAESEVELAAPQGKTYFCGKCLKYHRKSNSAIYKAHAQYEDHNVPTI